jgi:hypothetical protein
MKGFLIALACIYLYVENYSLTVKTTDENLNQLVGLPKQLPLKYVFLNDSENPLQMLQVYISPTERKYLL